MTHLKSSFVKDQLRFGGANEYVAVEDEITSGPIVHRRFARGPAWSALEAASRPADDVIKGPRSNRADNF